MAIPWLRALRYATLLAALAAGLGAARSQTAAATAQARAGGDRKSREAWFLRGRSASGQGAAELRRQALQQKLRMRAASQLATSNTLSISPRVVNTPGWTPLGPAPLCSDATGADANCNGGQQNYNWVSGRATAVAVDPNDASGNTVYVGGAQGGLWKSTNAGPMCPDPATVSWNAAAGCGGQSSLASLLDSQLSLAVGAIAVQPGGAPGQGVVLVGTGETNSSSDSYYGLGMLRSADGGQSWQLIGQDSATPAHKFAGIGFSQIAFSTNTPSLVIAAAAGAAQGLLDGREDPAQANLGLYYSSDSGQTWNYAAVNDSGAPLGPASVTAVVYDARYNNGGGAFFAAVRFHGFYISSDGVNWSRLANQPGFFLSTTACPAQGSQSCPIYRGALAVVPGRNEMYAWFVDANDVDGGLWQTLDGGNNWKPVDETGLANCGDLFGGCGSEDGAYNLTLAAVPDGANFTDLYAGAVNLFKCRLPANAAGNSVSCLNNGFLNLTHVFGCDPLGAIARVHPHQHAIDFLPINGNTQVVMYFANDGGIYRALDGYSGLTSGQCTDPPNQFDSLNQTLGSTTQFVSLAQHPTDANTLLGGAQGNGSPATASALGNGSPATASALNSTQWSNVNSSDGGYSAISVNPDQSSEWFTENTGVTIQSCSLGSICHAEDFSLVVSSATVGEDGGPLYTPFLVDPQNSAQMIVGTCRIWRGTVGDAEFSALSQNFETGTDATCTGNEVNTVRSLATGGPAINGASSVIYAGTDGTGPLAASPAGGHVWVMKNAPDGSVTWSDTTQAINPKHFPVAAIAIDPQDPSGNAAYVALMGFGATHIWRTTNGGGSWTAFDGNAPANLPDDPVNSLAVDGGTVYAGTDAGVFSSSTSNNVWVEVGSGPGGFLPNVPVTAVSVFDDGATQLLRAATYGRGVWQFPLAMAPDFQIVVAIPEETAFPSQIATFAVTIQALGGFADAVALTCAGNSQPATCSLDRTQVGFTLSASDSRIDDYNFQVQGTDASSLSGLTRVKALTLHVVDFDLEKPAQSTVVLVPGQTSSEVDLPIDAMGKFPSTGAFQLTCSAPTGVSCSLSAASVSTNAKSPNASVTLTALAGTAPGSYPVDVSASFTALGTTKTSHQTLTLKVVTSGYGLAPKDAALTLPARQAATVEQASAIAVDGYNSAVSLTCSISASSGSGPVPSCAVNPAIVTPSSAGTPFQITIGKGSAGSYTLTVQGTGADANAIAQSAQLPVTFYDFTVTPNNGSQTVNGGQPASYSLSIAPLGISTFPQAVSYGCAQLPASAVCTFDPGQVNSGNGVQTVTLTVSTSTSMAMSERRVRLKAGVIYAALAPAAVLLICFGMGKSARQRSVLVILLGCVLMCAVLQAACGGGLTGGTGGGAGGGGGGAGGTPPPQSTSNTYLFTVNVVEGTGGQALQQQVGLTLVVQ